MTYRVIIGQEQIQSIVIDTVEKLVRAHGGQLRFAAEFETEEQMKAFVKTLEFRADIKVE